MRVVYVLNSLSVGGAERLTIALARHTAERGHAVSVIALKPPKPADLKCSVPVFHLGMDRNPVNLAPGLVKAHRYLREFRPDVLHSHSFHSNMFARVLGMLSSVPVISTVHNVYEGGWRRMIVYRVTDKLSMQTVAVSNAVAERFVARGAVTPDRCRVIRNAIDLAAFAPDSESRVRTRAAMGIEKEFVWATVGRNAPAKDHPALLRAFEGVTAALPQSHLWIAGADFPSAEPLRSLATEASARGCSVRWLGLRNDLASLLDAADGFVMSSAWEGMPLALAEAMAMQKAVVTTDVGGVAELVGYAGVLVPPHRPDKLAEAMLAVMRLSAQERANMGVQARQRVAEEFSMSTRIEQWERLYCEVVGR